MSKKANFNVDPKLVHLLGETYKSTEYALKELIDNAYDADADNVWVKMPVYLDKSHEITITDDGSGMKEQEVRREYLNIASSRLARKGDRSIQKRRKVKGRKGIGKFSGLMVAEEMELQTYTNGVKTKINIIKSELEKEGFDLEKIDIPVTSDSIEQDKHGTSVVLRHLNQRLSIPNPDKLKEILVADYGREENFNIFVNDEKIGVTDLVGENYEEEIQLENGIRAKLVYTITEKQVKGSGISIRVGNKLVGKPVNFLEDDDVIPKKLKKRVFGELICDDLEGDVSADWGGIIENSSIYQTLSQKVTHNLNESLNQVYKQDMHLARQRYQQKINRELEKLPEYKRQFAEEALLKIIVKFFDDKGQSEKVDTLISLVIDALNKDHYWNVLKHLEETKETEVFSLAEALNDFGFAEIVFITNQARSRLKYLDSLDALINNKNTSEEQIHKALENSLWVLGNDYSLIFSNQTLKTAIKNFLDKNFTGKRKNKRPDLFLGSDMGRNYLLIEFKKPDVTLNRDHENQLIKYKDDLRSVIHDKPIECVLMGGKVNPKVFDENPRVKFLTFTDVLSNARTQLNWLIKSINT